MRVIVYGPPQGARRHRSTRSGRQYHGADHRDAETAIVDAIRDEIRRMRLLGPHVPPGTAARVEIRTEHRRPARLRRKRDRGVCTWYTGKPDADNIAKLVMDACTLAGVWHDDTCVSELTVCRRYVFLGADGIEGRERTEITISYCEDE